MKVDIIKEIGPKKTMRDIPIMSGQLFFSKQISGNI